MKLQSAFSLPDSGDDFSGYDSNSAAVSIGDFLDTISIEALPHRLENFLSFSSRLHVGARVYLTLLDVEQLPLQLTAASALIGAGLRPVVHVPARLFADRQILSSSLASYSKAGVKDVLLIGGNSSKAAGDFGSVTDILHTGIMKDFGFSDIFIAGHPESNAVIESQLALRGLDMFDLLAEKLDLIDAFDLRGHIVTQFLFDSQKLVKWLTLLRQRGITAPVHVGLAAPANLRTLIKYSISCGVSNSLSFLRHRSGSFAGLLNEHTPDEICSCIARALSHDNELGIASLHFFAFGGFERLFGWLSSYSPNLLRSAPAN